MVVEFHSGNSSEGKGFGAAWLAGMSSDDYDIPKFYINVQLI